MVSTKMGSRAVQEGRVTSKISQKKTMRWGGGGGDGSRNLVCETELVKQCKLVKRTHYEEHFTKIS